MSEPSRHALSGLPGDLPDAFVLAYGADDGDAAAFVRHGIAQPPSIQRSVPVRRAEYLAGRRAAVAALRAAGSHAVDLEISASRAPVWPTGFIGSVTHASGIAAAVALRGHGDEGIGIDIERIATGGALDAIVGGVIDEAEQGVLEPLVREIGRAAAFTIAFSAKESFYKATAGVVGRMFDFSALRLRSVSVHEGYVLGEVVEPLGDAWPVGRMTMLGFTLWEGDFVLTGCRNLPPPIGA